MKPFSYFNSHQPLIIGLLLILFAVNACQSIIGYSADQYFQIVAFAQFKKGAIPASDLAWEYHYQERQAIQPWLVYHFLTCMEWLRVEDPLNQTRMLRMLTALFTIVCIHRFVAATRHYFRPPFRTIYEVSSYLFWVIPCYYVHFASETFSQALMLLGAARLIRSPKNAVGHLFTGFLFGLAFFVRFQCAITISVLGLLYLLFEKPVKGTFITLLGGGMVAVAIGVGIDYWFYEEFVFTPYRYFEFQLVKGVVNDFGTSPFYYYLLALFSMSTPVVGLLMYLGLAGNVLAPKKHMLFWSVVVTVLVLSIVGHKEFRFLFQVLAFMPFLVLYGLQALLQHNPQRFSWVSKRWLWQLVGLVNLLMIVKGTLYNNGWWRLDDSAAIAPFITQHYYHERAHLFFLGHEAYPYKIRAFDPEGEAGESYLYRQFYIPPGLTDKKIENLSDPGIYESNNSATRLVCMTKAATLSGADFQRFAAEGYRLIDASVPLWLDRYLSQTSFWEEKMGHRVFYLFERQ